MRGMDGDDTPALARALTRLVVLPVPHPAPRPRDGLPGVQPPGRDRHVALAHRLARRALERHRRPLRRRVAGPPGPRLRGRRRPGGDGHPRALGRPAAGRGAARRGPRRHARRVAHGPVVARRPLPAAGRHRPARRGGAGAAPRRGPRHAHAPGPARRPGLRASTCGRTSSPAATASSPAPATCTSSASSSTRASPRPGRSSAAATG